MFSLTKKDFEITWFSGTGAGGQYRNKHQNCCRLKHIATGIISTGQSSRSQKENQREALNGIVKNPLFKIWLNNKVFGIESIEEKVNTAMEEGNLKIEYGGGGKYGKM